MNLPTERKKKPNFSKTSMMEHLRKQLSAYQRTYNFDIGGGLNQFYRLQVGTPLEEKFTKACSRAYSYGYMQAHADLLNSIECGRIPRD